MARPPSFLRCLVAIAAVAAAACEPSSAPSPASTPVPSESRPVSSRPAPGPGALARRHAGDAVEWRPWSPAVLAEAARLGRPLLVLTGFAASASCRDFSTDLFADPRFAADVNGGFVPVLVDRDERPDVDAFLMDAVAVLTGGGGWPAVVFVDPDGKPFEACSWGASAGECSPLKSLVDRVLRRIALGGGNFGVRAEMTGEKMQRRAAIDASGPLPDAKAVSDALRGYLASSFRADPGAFGKPPLFPRAPTLRFLLGRRDDADAAGMAIASLEAILRSELHDAAQGGFFRYAAGDGWKEPAREKMLADNAALASAFLDAAEATGRADLRAAARGILDFLRSKLALPDGAFALALSFDGLRDDRVLADANAVAISALLQGARVLGDERDREAAVAAATVVDARLREDGRVGHVLHADGSTVSEGYLADAALLGLAFLDLDAAAAPGGKRWLEAAEAIADDLVRRFEHEGSGGFFQTASDAEPLPLRLKPSLDAAVPCGNSAAALLFTRLAARTGAARHAAAARRTFEGLAEPLTLKPLALPAMVSALEEFARAGAQASAPPQLDPDPAVHP